MTTIAVIQHLATTAAVKRTNAKDQAHGMVHVNLSVLGESTNAGRRISGNNSCLSVMRNCASLSYNRN